MRLATHTCPRCGDVYRAGCDDQGEYRWIETDPSVRALELTCGCSTWIQEVELVGDQIVFPRSKAQPKARKPRERPRFADLYEWMDAIEIAPHEMALFLVDDEWKFDAVYDLLREHRSKPTKLLPWWLVARLSTNDVTRVWVQIPCNLDQWVKTGKPSLRSYDKDAADLFTSPDDPAVDEVMHPYTEAQLLTALLHQQGYDEVTERDVEDWLDGNGSPSGEVLAQLQKLRDELPNIVPYFQAEQLAHGLFARVATAAITHDDPVSRRMQGNEDLRRLMGEHVVPLDAPLRLPQRYLNSLFTLGKLLQMDTGALVNLWLERSIEFCLGAYRLTRGQDALGAPIGARARKMRMRLAGSLARKRVKGVVGREVVG